MSEHKMPETKEDAIRIFGTWIRQRPGLEWGNYGDTSSYRAELRTIAKQKHRAEAALVEFASHDYDAYLLRDTMSTSFSGRLEFDARGNLEYTTGQYWPTEYRIAAAVCLEEYNRHCRKRWAIEHDIKPAPFRTVADVKAANHAAGGCWFEKSTMRFFGTRIESALYTRGSGNQYFITSEQDDHHPRKYTIRQAHPNGDVDTVGDFQAYRSLEDARDAVKMLA